MPTDRQRWLATPLSPRAYAWCGDCPWRVEGVWSHKHADHHAMLLGHVAHCDDGLAPVACNEVYVGGFAEPMACHAPAGHEGDHRAEHHTGQTWTWPNRGVDNPVESVDSRG